MTDVTFPGVDGHLVGVLCEPPLSEGGQGAVLVLPEIDGFCEGTVAAARRLASAGYVALALNPFSPYGPTPPLRGSEDTMAWLARLNDRRQLSDLAMALAWLRERPGVDADRVGIVGFSIGGRFAMMLTTEPHGVAAVAAFYSRPWPGGAIAPGPGRFRRYDLAGGVGAAGAPAVSLAVAVAVAFAAGVPAAATTVAAFLLPIPRCLRVASRLAVASAFSAAVWTFFVDGFIPKSASAAASFSNSMRM